MTSHCVSLKRARPLLGTFAEISAEGGNFAETERAIDLAFEQIATVQQLMSFHDPESDVSRINRALPNTVIQVHSWTWEVLSIAQELEKASRGVFDITIAPVLERWGYLPNLQNTADRLGGSAYALLRENRVQFSHALHIDLGGIAKGFAVDRAADALQGEGVSAGVVNCGGDLRAFGEETHTIHLRHPASPQHAVGAVQMANTALATSASYFSRKSFENQLVSPLLDGRRNTACVDEVSVTVIAKQSVFADALTKVVIALREESVPVLTRYGASAIILNANGQVERLP